MEYGFDYLSQNYVWNPATVILPEKADPRSTNEVATAKTPSGGDGDGHEF